MESAALGKKIDIQAVEEVDIQVVVEQGRRLDTVVDILVEEEGGGNISDCALRQTGDPQQREDFLLGLAGQRNVTSQLTQTRNTRAE